MEKKQPVEHVRTVSSSDDPELQQQDGSKPPIQDPNWKPGFWIRFPWIGFFALVMILVCCGISVVILEVSNGQSEHSWPQRLPPNVLLNIMNNVANICFGIAIGNGIAIAWWRRVLRGSSIKDLHRTWSFSTSLKEVVFSFKYFNVVALAALTAKLTLIDSSLMQNALTFYSDVDTTPIPISNITGYASTEWPNTGTVGDQAGEAQYMQEWPLGVFTLWRDSAGDYPTESWRGCHNAFCFTNVPAFGFKFDCRPQTSEHANIMQSLTNRSNDGSGDTVFDISFKTVYRNEIPYYEDVSYDTAYIFMNVTWTTSYPYFQGEDTCDAEKRNMACNLIPHVIEYPAVIDRISNVRTISVGARKLNKWSELGAKSTAGFNPDLHSMNFKTGQQNNFIVKEPIIINETQTFTKKEPRSKLAGVQLLLQTALGGRAVLHLSSDTFSGIRLDTSGSSERFRSFASSKPGAPAGCVADYGSPFRTDWTYNFLTHKKSAPSDSLVALINQLMFGLAIDVSVDDRYLEPDHGQIFNGTRYPYAVHYRVHSEYMWGAIAATVCCVLLVLPVYWGFWQLGRKVSLNPFEIAHAFRSPVIAQAHTAAPQDLMKEVGDQEVRYGPVTLDGEAYGRFGVAAPQNVATVHETGLRESFRPVMSRGERPGAHHSWLGHIVEGPFRQSP